MGSPLLKATKGPLHFMKLFAKTVIALLLALLALLGAAAAGAGQTAPADTGNRTPPLLPQPETDAGAEAPPEEPRYTLRLSASALPESWNPLRPEQGLSEVLRRCLSAGLYELGWDAEGNCRPLPVMAAELPEDVTDVFAKQLGLTEDASGQAYRIPLRTGLRWQDGSPITAEDFVESAKRLLDPQLGKDGASLFTEGALVLCGAGEYRNQLQPSLLENALCEQFTLSDLTPDGDGQYCTPDGYPVFIALDYPLTYLLYGKRLRFYVEAYGDSCFDLRSWDTLLERMDSEGLLPLTEENYALFQTLTMGNPAWGDTEATLPFYFIYAIPSPPVSWSGVGIIAPDPDTLILLLEHPLSALETASALTERWLVNPALYDACKREECTYGGGPESILSCGPYLLKELQPGVGCILVRNPHYYAWESPDPGYQTTEIRLTLVSGEEEARGRFDAGLADACLLSGAVEAPEGSEAREIPGGTVFLMAFNPDFDALAQAQAAAGEQINKTILTLPEFRQAMSFSLDRKSFCQAVFPGHRPALGLLSSLTLADPAEGVPYRFTEPGQAVLADVWGAAAEAGGYDPARAKELFDLAWTRALEAGYLTEEDRVELTVAIPGNGTDVNRQGYDYLVRQYTEAVSGTRLEGKLSFTLAEDPGEDLHDAIRQNRVDLLFGVGWAAEATDPAALMEAYLSENYRYDPAWDAKKETLHLTVDGESISATLPELYAVLQGETVAVTDPAGEVRELSLSGDPALPARLLAALEETLLKNADVIPLTEACSTLLTVERLQPLGDVCHPLLGFGGLRYLQYACSDQAWEAGS